MKYFANFHNRATKIYKMKKNIGNNKELKQIIYQYPQYLIRYEKKVRRRKKNQDEMELNGSGLNPESIQQKHTAKSHLINIM